MTSAGAFSMNKDLAARKIGRWWRDISFWKVFHSANDHILAIYPFLGCHRKVSPRAFSSKLCRRKISGPSGLVRYLTPGRPSSKRSFSHSMIQENILPPPMEFGSPKMAALSQRKVDPPVSFHRVLPSLPSWTLMLCVADLVLKRKGNPTYLRDKNEDSKRYLRALLLRLGRDAGGLDRSFFLVNSPLILARIGALCPDHQAVRESGVLQARATRLAPALHLLALADPSRQVHSVPFRCCFCYSLSVSIYPPIYRSLDLFSFGVRPFCKSDEANHSSRAPRS